MSRKVLVCGGRDYDNSSYVYTRLDEVHASPYWGPIDILCQGGASGAEAIALSWARDRDIECLTLPAEYAHYGRAAGPIRNRLMLDKFRPTLIIAFPGGRSTANMMQLASERKVTVLTMG